MTISISAPVGLSAANKSTDVVKVQVMLNHFIGNKKLLGYKPLGIDGTCGAKTREAILALQFQNGLVSEEHFKCQIYPHGKTIAFMRANAGYIPTWELPDHPTSLLDLLSQVQTDEVGQTELQRKHLGRLKQFFIRGLEGEAVDDTYWTFVFYDALGRKYPCDAKNAVDAVERSEIKQKALLIFTTQAKGATTKEEVGKVLRRVEERVACNTFVLTRWHHQNSALGDGSLAGFQEMAYLKEMALLVARREPESIYAVYGDEIVTAYPVVRPIFSRWKMQRSRRSG